MPKQRIDQLYSERRLTARELAGIRDRINAWANSIPHHPYANLGSSITITQATEKPTHAVSLIMSYERRCVMWNLVPYHGEPVSHVPGGDEHIRVWGYSLPDLAMPGEGEAEVEQDIPLADTGSLVQCDSCGGRGEDVCWSCHGVGTEVCGSCNRGWNHCYSCGGSGRVQSGEFNNQPIHTNCSNCAGRGEIRCSRCGGRGELRCGRCNGSGRLVCGRCEGRGHLLRFLSIHQSKSTLGKFKRVHHPATPDAWRCDFPALDALTLKGYGFAEAEGLRTPVLELNQAIHALVTASKKPKGRDYGVVGQELCVRGWVFRIRRVPHFEVSYSFNGKHYSIWLHGTQERVHAPDSPVSELRDHYRKEAFKLHSQGGIARVDALASINKAAAMGELSRQEESLRNKILLALQFPYVAGGILGGLSSLAVIECVQPPFVWWKLCLAAIYGWITGGALFKRTFSVIRKPLADFVSAFALSAAASVMAAFTSLQVTAASVFVLMLALMINGGDEKPSPPGNGPARSSVPADTDEAEEADSDPDGSEYEATPDAGEYEDSTKDSEPMAEDNDAGDTVETIWARSVLGVSADASESDITSAYRRKMIEYHPDKVTHLAKEYRDLAEQRSKDLNKAREILKANSHAT